MIAAVMENYVTYNIFFWAIGGGVAVVSALVGYWINQIKSVDVRLEKHRENDAKEFADYKLQNQKITSDLQRYVDQKNGEMEKVIVKINENMQYTADAVRRVETHILKNQK